MGAWGIKTFENDDACDWLYDLEETSDLSLVKSTLELAQNDYLESPDGCCILAAAEIILALQGKPRDGFPESISDWVSNHTSLDTTPLTSLALTSLNRVLSEESELKELWEETDDYEKWKGDVLSIKSAIEI